MVGGPTEIKCGFVLETTFHQYALADGLHLKSELLPSYVGPFLVGYQSLTNFKDQL